MSHLLLLAVALAVAPASSPPPCAERTPIAVSLDGDVDGTTRALVMPALARGCFDALVVDTLDSAAKPSLRARLALNDGAFSVSFEGLDVNGAVRFRVAREGNAPGAGSVRPDVLSRTVDDALRAVRGRLGLPSLEAPKPARACAEADKVKVVVLWHKDTPAEARDAIGRVLGRHCVDIAEAVDGQRRLAMDQAAFLEVPLLAFKATAEVVEGELSIAVVADAIDASKEELHVTAHSSERARRPAASPSQLWSDVDALFERAVAKVAPAPTAPR